MTRREDRVYPNDDPDEAARKYHEANDDVTLVRREEDPINPAIDLDPYIPERDYAEYYIGVVKRTVRREDSFVRQVFYTVLSKNSDNPLNLAVMAKTSAGKTYGITETLQYFPNERGEIWRIGSMSPKVIIRQNGLLVDKHYQPLEPQIKEIKRKIRRANAELAANKKDQDKSEKIITEIEKLEDEIVNLVKDARILIELTGKCLVFLEPPHSETWNILKTTLSHDHYEIEHPYVYEVQGMGFSVKKVVTRGWPSCIFASARDESKWDVWPEIQSRFLVISPNIVPEKVYEGNVLTAQKRSLPDRVKSKIIVSYEARNLARKCASHLIQVVKSWMTQVPDLQKQVFWIPYGLILGASLPAEKGTDNRVTNRIFAFLQMVALLRHHLRFRLEYFKESLIIPTVGDLHERVHLMQNISGIPDYKLAMFKDYYYPCYTEKYKGQNGRPDVSKDGKREEDFFGLTNSEFCKYYKEKTGKVLPTKNFRETYIEEWYANGLIEKVESVINSKQHITYPIVPLSHSDDGDDNDEKNKEKEQPISYGLESVYKIDGMGVSARSPMDLLPKPIVVQKDFKPISKNWLKLQVSGFLQLTFEKGRRTGEITDSAGLSEAFRIYDERNERICLCQFFDRYGPPYDLNAYFLNGISHKNPQKIGTVPKYSHGHEPKDCISIDDCLQSPLTSILNAPE